MVSKKKILSGIEDHLINMHCCKVDTELNEYLPSDMKKEAVKKMTLEYSELLEIRSRLNKILV